MTYIYILCGFPREEFIPPALVTAINQFNDGTLGKREKDNLAAEIANLTVANQKIMAYLCTALSQCQPASSHQQICTLAAFLKYIKVHNCHERFQNEFDGMKQFLHLGMAGLWAKNRHDRIDIKDFWEFWEDSASLLVPKDAVRKCIDAGEENLEQEGDAVAAVVSAGPFGVAL